MGWNEQGGHMCKKKVFLILWNVALIIILLTFCVLQINLTKNFGHSKSELSNVTSSTSYVALPNGKLVLIQLMFTVMVSSFCVSSLILSIYLAVVGPALLNRLSTKNFIRVEPRDEYRIAKLILTFQVTMVLVTVCLSFYFFLSFFSITDMISYSVMNALSTNTNLTVWSLIAYKCLTVRQQFRNIPKLTVRYDLEKIYRLVFKIARTVKELDKYLSPYLLFSLIALQILCISSLCHLVMDKLKIIENSTTLLYALTNLFIHCYVCNAIPCSLKDAIETIEVSFDDRVIDANDRIIIGQLKDMSDKIGFTSFGLFNININTFVSSLGLIITYAVIIIQTGGQ